jgi:hypothetical protein
VLNQINLQLNNYDGGSTTGNQHALRGTSDNLLDIIDIIQGDANLNAAAGGTGTPGHVGGFAEMPGGLTGTITRFQDNQPQTNFWAAFAAEGNTINAHLLAVAADPAAGGANAAATAALVTQIQNYENFGASFDAAQGDIFRGRFDNELNSGTLQADTAAAVHGLTGILNGDTGAALAADNAQITAAGMGFVADAMDVGGNNVPIGGGTHVGSATTVATATSVNNVAQGTIPVTANPNIANGTGGTATSSTTTSPTTTSGGGAPTGGGTNPNGTGVTATSSTTTSPTTTSGGGAPTGGGSGAGGGADAGGSTGSGGGAGTGAGDGHGTGTGSGSGASASGTGTGTGGGSGTGTGTGGSTGIGATGTGASGGGTDHNAGHGGDALANDIASLLQALQSGNSSGVSSAVKALGDDVHNGAATDVGSVTSAMSHMHLETFWHH